MDNHALTIILLTLGFSFGPGYQSLSVVILPTLVLMLWLCRRGKYTVLCAGAVFCSNAIGSFLAYSGSFESRSQPSLNSPKTLQLIPFALLFSTVLSLICTFDRLFFKFSKVSVPCDIFFGFPLLWTVGWSLFYLLSGYGDFGSWHMALSLLEIEPLTRGASFLFGSFLGGCYVSSVIVSTIYHGICSYFEGDFVFGVLDKYGTSYRRSTPRWLSGLVFVGVVWLVGSWQGLYPGSFYQYPIQKYAPKSYISAACLIGGTFEKTAQLLESRGNIDLVVWSELSVHTLNNSQLIENAKKISNDRQIMLGVSYSEILSRDDSSYSRNKFALFVSKKYLPWDSNNTLEYFEYQKTHPVPNVERNTEAGPGELKSIRTIFGKITAAICFDLNFPFIDQLSSMNASLLIQPSATWGPVGLFHSKANRLRTLDNGMTLFRCSSNGISGIYDPWNRVIAEKITLGRNDGLFGMIPVRQKVQTLYTWLGFDVVLFSMLFALAARLCWSLFIIDNH